jgi:hypothetical protein
MVRDLLAGFSSGPGDFAEYQRSKDFTGGYISFYI